MRKMWEIRETERKKKREGRKGKDPLIRLSWISILAFS